MLFLLQFTLLLCKVLSLLRQIIVQILLKFFLVNLKFNTKKQKFSNYFFRLRVSDRPTPYGLKRLLDDLDSGTSTLPGEEEVEHQGEEFHEKKMLFN